MINAGCNLERSLLSFGRCVRQLWDIQICSKTLCSSLVTGPAVTFNEIWCAT